MGKFCAKCGNEIEKDATFCANCGTSAKETKAAVKVEETSTQSGGTNVFGILGFIFSFFVPVLGLIFSIIGLRKADEMGGSNRGLAKAGLILSIVFLALIVVIYIIYFLILGAAAVGSSYYY